MGRKAGITIGTALAAMLVLPAAAAAGSDAAAHRYTTGSQVLGDGIGAGLVIREENGISYVSGGVGDDQQNVLQRVGKQFNLKLTLAGQRGHYLGGADIRIDDGTGKSRLATYANGPLFLAKLPAGTYKVHATAQGKTFTRELTIPENGQRQVVMTWPEAAEGAVRAGDAPEK